MSTSIILGCLYVLAATVTAMLPMKRQYIPGVCLLLGAPLLLIYIGYEHGLIVAGLCVLAFVSMMRNPLRYLWAKLRGQNPELPPELR